MQYTFLSRCSWDFETVSKIKLSAELLVKEIQGWRRFCKTFLLIFWFCKHSRKKSDPFELMWSFSIRCAAQRLLGLIKNPSRNWTLCYFGFFIGFALWESGSNWLHVDFPSHFRAQGISRRQYYQYRDNIMNTGNAEQRLRKCHWMKRKGMYLLITSLVSLTVLNVWLLFC